MMIEYLISERTRRGLMRFIRGHRGWRVDAQADQDGWKRLVVIVGSGNVASAYEAIDGEFGRLIGWPRRRPGPPPNGHVEMRIVEASHPRACQRRCEGTSRRGTLGQI